MRPPRVVVRGVLGQHPAEVSLAEDQHPVGHFGADGQHEAFGETVRPRTTRRDLDLWVPITRSPHATCTYSWMRPPSRSRRSGRTVAPERGGGVLPAWALIE